MLNIEVNIKDIQDIINYFIECDVNDKYYESEQ